MDQPLKVLLVENESLIYSDLVDFFEANDCEVLKHSRYGIVDSYEAALDVLKTNIPHIAVLDIELEGKKTGIQLGNYIIEHFWCVVMIVTGKSTKENHTAASRFGAFIVKRDKPLDKIQLIADLERLKPIAEQMGLRRTLGSFFDVTEFPIIKERKEIRKNIQWDDIKYIRTKDAAKNNVAFTLKSSRHCKWQTPLTMDELEKELPPFIVRFNPGEFVNVKHIDRSSNTPYTYYMGDMTFNITGAYKISASALISIYFNQF
jgi:two-component system response regulator LytT